MLAFSLLLPTVCCKVPPFATIITLGVFPFFLELGVLLWPEVSYAPVLLPFLLSGLGCKDQFFLIFF